MDILSHALWAGAAAGAIRLRRPLGNRLVAATVLLAILPDAGQIAPVFAWSLGQEHPLGLMRDFVAATPGHEPALPPLVQFLSHHLHCALHSAVILSLLTIAVWRTRPAALPVLVGWWLHIALDIPTHSNDYYAVPFLYPLTYWGVDGIPWTTPWLLALNYAALAIAYAVLWHLRRRRRPGQG